MTGKETLEELLSNPIFIARTNGKAHYNKCILAINKDLEKLEKLEKVVEILKKQLVFRYRQDDVLEIHKDIWRKNHPKIVLVTSWDEDVLLKEVLGDENT